MIYALTGQRRSVASDAQGGGWITTFTGGRFWPLAPRACDVDVRDIAHALALKCRYSGHCKSFYSVAQHSVLVSAFLEREGYDRRVRLVGLLHDAAEAYLVDMPRPIKYAPEMDGYRKLEDAVQAAVYAKFGLPAQELACVKKADEAMLELEMRHLMPEYAGKLFYAQRGLDWDGPCADIAFVTRTPEASEEMFLCAFNALPVETEVST